MHADEGLRDFHKQLNGLLGEQLPIHWSEMKVCSKIPASSSASVLSPSSFIPVGANFIEHRVTKLDTLAGVAIKYGVEVADIRRLNGLVTDLQMYARKSLQIPLPGRHPPSPAMSNGSSQSGVKSGLRQTYDIANSLQSLEKPSPRRVSPAMCNLQGYYGLTKSKSRLPEGTEMAILKSGKILMFENQNKNSANGYLVQNESHSENIDEVELSTRRQWKPDDDPSLHTPEILLKEDGAGDVFSGRAGKGLALRLKLGSRTDVAEGSQNLISVSDSIENAPISVRKSSSSSNLSEPENIASIWPTSKWILKPDLIARPIMDGFQKPLTAWRSKTALD